MKTNSKITIIIVNYNTKELLAACLDSLRRAEGDKKQWEIFVVDNGSTDESIAFLDVYAKTQKTFSKFIVIKNIPLRIPVTTKF